MTTYIVFKAIFTFIFWLVMAVMILKIIKNFRKCYKAHQDLISGADMAETEKGNLNEKL